MPKAPRAKEAPTISETARLEVLRRLGELNRQRYEEEQAVAPPAKPRTKGRAKAVPDGQGSLALAEKACAKTIVPTKTTRKRSSR